MTVPEWQERLNKLRVDYDPFNNLNHFEDLVTEATTINTWEEFQTWCAPFKRAGCFRGQADAAWHLYPSFYRKVYQRWSLETATKSTEGVGVWDPDANELAILREFQRAAHHHYAITPGLDQVVDWLALMQHHGAPTRMLDWTRSPYVALYFAMQESDSGQAALWAIDLEWLRLRSYQILREKRDDCPKEYDHSSVADYVNRILLQRDNPYVIVRASPVQINERMQIQQGELLCGLQHEPAFSTLLLSMLFKPGIPGETPKQVVSKVFVKRDRRIEFLEELRRMNIHEASLFPGLDGFARSLGVNLEISVANQIEEHKQTLRDYLQSKAAG